MIILSIGMPRAGSGWYYNLTNDLMLACGAKDAHRIREQYHLHNILTEVNCNIGALTPRRLIAVLIPSLLGNTFVVKGHAGPTPLAKQLIQRGIIRATYIHRDPRDALLSAYENGKRAAKKGKPNAFSHLVDFETAVKFMQDYLRISEAWLQNTHILITRYEDLLLNYDQEVIRLINFLELKGDFEAIKNVIEKYRPANPLPDQKGLHFRQGKIGRFRTHFSPEEQEIMKRAFGSYLERVGYVV